MLVPVCPGAYLEAMKLRDTTLPLPPQEDPAPEIRALARRYARANGVIITLMNRLGGTLEERLEQLPAGLRGRVETVTSKALTRALSIAYHGNKAPDLGPKAVPALAALTGAVGGAGGLATALAELPVTVTLIFHAILRAAEAEGFDAARPEVRAAALRVLSAGGPMTADDGINTAFLSMRLTITGPMLHALLARVVPKFSITLSQKLALQAVPILGAVSGATLNATFLAHYRELAHIQFALMRLSALHGAEPVGELFGAEIEALKLNAG
ncbi:MAG: EcsC family protein [Pseudorhodobacter sp.]